MAGILYAIPTPLGGAAADALPASGGWGATLVMLARPEAQKT